MKQKFISCLFVDEETNGSYPYANRLNGLNGLAHLSGYVHGEWGGMSTMGDGVLRLAQNIIVCFDFNNVKVARVFLPPIINDNKLPSRV
jgi:hypothetical protein